ncbi:MAG: beta-lactamase family protein [Clostridia bacterium]|nr:beta-lactamase family protein [Clostridia bacterium]
MKKLDADVLSSRLAERNKKDIADGLITCSQAIVTQSGRRVVAAEYGTNGINGEKLKSDATFRIASMTKPITVFAVLQQAEKGNIDINAPITEYIDGYKNLPIGRVIDGKFQIIGKNKTDIKIYHLFSHTSGIESGDIVSEFTAKLTEKDKSSLKSVVEYFSDKPLFFATGTAQSYSPHVAFDIGAYIVEKVSGLDFETYIKKNITDVIGMKDTTFTPTAEQWRRLVIKHARDKDGKAIDGNDDRKHIYGDHPLTYYCGGAGLMSSAKDYSLFAETLLNGGVAPNGKRVIDKKYLKEMFTPYCPIGFMDEGTIRTGVTWGLGVRVFTNGNGKLPKGTFGWSGAYGTHFWVDPVNGITAVYMTNSDNSGGAGAVTADNFENDVMASLT